MIDILLKLINGPGLVMTVFGCGVVLTVKLRAAFGIKKLVRAVRNQSGDMPPVKAMCIALAGTLGVGNIAGVASAISVGGAGAVFWMWISALFAMAIKYAETVLALKHRRQRHGGAFYYMSDSGAKGAARIFALLCIFASFSIGSSIQSNAAATCLESQLGISPKLSGVIFAVCSFIIISGGSKRINSFIMTAVPVASLGYALISFYIIFADIGYLPVVLRQIISEALGVRAFAGGITGFFTSKALSLGVTRGLVSNEAGCGTAPIAHSGSDAKEPAVQGIFGMLEVFIDTLFLCSLTAFVVLIARERGVVLSDDGMTAALEAFGEFIRFSGTFLSASVTLFAFASVICWYFYGSESLFFLGAGKGTGLVYRIGFSLATGIGAVLGGGILWELSDITIGAMTMLNLFFVMKHLTEIKRETGTLSDRADHGTHWGNSSKTVKKFEICIDKSRK